MKFRKAFKTFEGAYQLDFFLSKHVEDPNTNHTSSNSRRGGEISSRTRFLFQSWCLGIVEIEERPPIPIGKELKLSGTAPVNPMTVSTNSSQSNDQKLHSNKTLLVTCSCDKTVYAWYLNQSLRYQKEEKPFITLNPRGGLTSSSALHSFEAPTNLIKSSSNLSSKKKEVISDSDNTVIELLIGFNTSDIVLYNIKTKQQLYFNKDRKISSSSITKMIWIDSNIFCVAHKDGTIMFYDKNLKIEEPFNSPPFDEALPKHKKYKCVANPVEECNPLRKITLGQSIITDVSISPNNSYLATVTSNGRCEIIDLKTMKQYASFISEQLGPMSFGGFTSCCWSPDSKVLVTGGEDDSLNIFDVKRKSIVLKGVGHTGFVSKVIFDPYQCDATKYRLISVGDDTKLMLWDLDKSYFTEEREISNAIDIKSNNPFSSSGIKNMPPGQESMSFSTTSMNQEETSNEMLDIPLLEPIAIHKAHNDPIRDVKVFTTGIATICNQGIINFWARPVLIEDESDLESQDMTTQEETSSNPMIK
ncbi:hypothetical protein C9374_004907 [Naegleria lovaniensis]|uniref:Guanine nucleotide-binding protein subunit beta-like protein n=1 Tax=Naegleria lovaniensis TaxID=51637 RepID=A0AA88KKV3_NAELO|nr:uncharacterized protein C9374_004907 [Naegleria lovaniensis]KAG2382940.1 hypothetical protein C9374_004907 [Naegleria lovaniensis]